MDKFEIKKIEELMAQSREQDEKLFKLRKRLARAERNILGYSMETGNNGKER